MAACLRPWTASSTTKSWCTKARRNQQWLTEPRLADSCHPACREAFPPLPTSANPAIVRLYFLKWGLACLSLPPTPSFEQATSLGRPVHRPGALPPCGVSPGGRHHLRQSPDRSPPVAPPPALCRPVPCRSVPGPLSVKRKAACFRGSCLSAQSPTSGFETQQRRAGVAGWAGWQVRRDAGLVEGHTVKASTVWRLAISQRPCY